MNLMSGEANELLKRALSLPVGERAELAGSIIESLDTSEDEGVKAAWDKEITRRMKDFDQGVPGISLEEFRQRLRAAIE